MSGNRWRLQSLGRNVSHYHPQLPTTTTLDTRHHSWLWPHLRLGRPWHTHWDLMGKLYESREHKLMSFNLRYCFPSTYPWNPAVLSWKVIAHPAPTMFCGGMGRVYGRRGEGVQADVAWRWREEGVLADELYGSVGMAERRNRDGVRADTVQSWHVEGIRANAV